MSIGYIEHPQDGYVEVEINGRVGHDDIDRVMPQLRAFLAAQGTISVLQVVRSLGFVNLPAALPHMGFGIAALSKVKRVALVTDLIWLTQMTRTARYLSPVEIRIFSLSEQGAAREWVKRAPHPARDP